MLRSIPSLGCSQAGMHLAACAAGQAPELPGLPVLCVCSAAQLAHSLPLRFQGSLRSLHSLCLLAKGLPLLLHLLHMWQWSGPKISHCRSRVWSWSNKPASCNLYEPGWNEVPAACNGTCSCMPQGTEPHTMLARLLTAHWGTLHHLRLSLEVLTALLHQPLLLLHHLFRSSQLPLLPGQLVSLSSQVLLLQCQLASLSTIGLLSLDCSLHALLSLLLQWRAEFDQHLHAVHHHMVFTRQPRNPAMYNQQAGPVPRRVCPNLRASFKARLALLWFLHPPAAKQLGHATSTQIFMMTRAIRQPGKPRAASDTSPDTASTPCQQAASMSEVPRLLPPAGAGTAVGPAAAGGAAAALTPAPAGPSAAAAAPLLRCVPGG